MNNHTQQQMNDMWPQSVFPPQMGRMFNPPLPPPQEAKATLVLRVGRPNCGWLRNGLWEAKRLGRIDSYEESTGWLWRSFAICGTVAQLQMVEKWVRSVIEVEE